jgi:hypothetical protein
MEWFWPGLADYSPCELVPAPVASLSHLADGGELALLSFLSERQEELRQRLSWATGPSPL